MQNLIVERLMEQKKRTTAMISPWLRRIPSRQETTGAEAVSENPPQPWLHVSKQKMLALNGKKLETVYIDKLNNFSLAITKKFQGPGELFHTSPKIHRGGETWNSLERIFPMRSEVTHEEPPQPGEMRSGTVIQKFDMFPKKEQPLASFKQQSAQISERERSKEFQDKNKPVSPGQRLYSRVTEITPKKTIEPELPVNQVAEKPVEPEVRTSEALKKLIEPEIPPIETAEKREPVSPGSKNVEELQKPMQRADQPKMQESTPKINPIPVEDRPVQKKTKEQSPTPPHPSVEMPLSKVVSKPEPAKLEKKGKSEKLGNSEVVKQTGLLKAQPILPPIVEKPSKSLPVKKESPSQGKIPVQPKQQSSSNQTVQRANDLPSSQETEKSPLLTKDDSESDPSQMMPLKEENTPVSMQTTQETVEKEMTSTQKGNQLPLQSVVEQHNQTSKGLLRSKSTEQSKPRVQPSLINHPQMPLVPPQKYQVTTNADVYKGREETSSQKEVTSIPQNYENLDIAYTQLQKITQNFPLKHESNLESRVQTETRINPPIQPHVTNEESPELFQPRQPHPPVRNEAPRNSTPAIQSDRNVIHRIEESPVPVPVHPPAMDFKKLAEDVFPFVKRLMEIERERTRGSLR